jgi:hypothetical protein
MCSHRKWVGAADVLCVGASDGLSVGGSDGSSFGTGVLDGPAVACEPSLLVYVTLQHSERVRACSLLQHALPLTDLPVRQHVAHSCASAKQVELSAHSAAAVAVCAGLLVALPPLLAFVTADPLCGAPVGDPVDAFPSPPPLLPIAAAMAVGATLARSIGGSVTELLFCVVLCRSPAASGDGGEGDGTKMEGSFEGAAVKGEGVDRAAVSSADGCIVGAIDGDSDSDSDGERDVDGAAEATAEILTVTFDGDAVGEKDGMSVGVGVTDGIADGIKKVVNDGIRVEFADGSPDGFNEGMSVGVTDGIADGMPVRFADGANDGVADGIPVADGMEYP